jgi:hypothetical protein
LGDLVRGAIMITYLSISTCKKDYITIWTCLTQMMQTLSKNLFNSMIYWEYLYWLFSMKIFQ